MRRCVFPLVVALLSCTRRAPPPATPAEPPPPAVVVPDNIVVAAPTEPPTTGTPPSSGVLKPPTDAEFAAWDRVDVAGEKKVHQWDKANLPRMLAYWGDVACLRERVRVEGELAFGAAAGSAAEDRFFQFKQKHIAESEAWLNNFFAAEPRVLEKSKFPGHLLEAHELTVAGYPAAFTSGDRAEIEKCDAQWAMIEAKTKKYVESLSGTWIEPKCAAAGGKTKPRGR